MAKILGIDPGTRFVGFGIIEHDFSRSIKSMLYITSGVIELKQKDMFERLAQIQSDIVEVIDNFCPGMMVIEKMFVANNPDTALKLGQARGVAISSAQRFDMPIFEYGVNEVKKHVAGYGKCSKSDMQEAVKHHLRLGAVPREDASDALGLSICHAMHASFNS